MLSNINSFLTLWFVIPLVVVVGLYLLISLKGIQFTHIKSGVYHLLKGDDLEEKGSISNFQAVSAVLAGNLGTGNISGMAVAIATGGPGALFWMWLMGFLGMGLKYAGCYLGVRYREVNSQGEYVGGPMYYLFKGVKSRFLAVFFCIVALTAAFTVGNIVQVNSLVQPLENSNVSSLFVSCILAVIIGITLLGGLQRIASVVAGIVPAMTLIYLIGALLILFLNYQAIPGALNLVIQSAFGFSSIGGALVGTGTALIVGVERGIFATDAGIGVAPILQSGARVGSPAAEGLVAMVPPLVVLIVCTLTTLVLIVTGAYEVSGLKSTGMCVWAFKEGLGHQAAGWPVILALVLFGFTTILAWAFCAEKAVEFLFGVRAIPLCHVLFVASIPVGAILSVESAWELADFAIALMLCCNLIGILKLRKEINSPG